MTGPPVYSRAINEIHIELFIEHLLYSGKKHWRQEEKEKDLLI